MTKSTVDDAGKVALIGGGPGDPDLITVKAYRMLEQADVVLYDHLVDGRLLDICRPTARCIDVGKVPGKKQTCQNVINGLLAKEAAQGNFVIRLKGGDPFVFGRGSEEAIYLRKRGIDVEIVNGISSCISAPASAYIPVTHRGVTTHFSVISGMSSTQSAEEMAKQWRQLARAGGTLVFLMGVGRLEQIIEAVKDGGVDGSQPAAMIRAGTTAEQQVIEATVDTIVDAVREVGLRPPATLIVGDVVALRSEILARTAQTEPIYTAMSKSEP